MKDRSYKWWLLAFLFVTFILEQGTRQVYNAALPQIRLDFLSYSAFYLAGALVLLPAMLWFFRKDYISQD